MGSKTPKNFADVICTWPQKEKQLLYRLIRLRWRSNLRQAVCIYGFIKDGRGAAGSVISSSVYLDFVWTRHILKLLFDTYSNVSVVYPWSLRPTIPKFTQNRFDMFLVTWAITRCNSPFGRSRICRRWCWRFYVHLYESIYGRNPFLMAKTFKNILNCN